MYFSQQRFSTSERKRKDAEVPKRPLFAVKCSRACPHLLDDVGHAVPVCQLDVVSSVHQALVSLPVKIHIYCLSVNEDASHLGIIKSQIAVCVY